MINCVFSFCVESQASQEGGQAGREENRPEIKTASRLCMKKTIAAKRIYEREEIIKGPSLSCKS